jgi:nucleotide-binding universal stress UspA family protein
MLAAYTLRRRYLMAKKLKSVLVPLDGSPLAEDALPFAREFSRRLGVEVNLFHVCEPGGEDSRFMCQVYVDRTAETLQPGDDELPIKSLAVLGKAADEIIDHARDNDIDFILMATHGRSGMGKWLLGSTADKVLRASPVPVLLVRAGARLEAARVQELGRTLLVPLDGSEYAESVLPYVEALAAGAGPVKTKVILLRVYERPFVTADYPEPDWEAHVERIVGQFRKAAEDYLAGIKGKLAGDLDVSTVVLEGNPAEQIVRYAQEHALEMIVMATHGNSALAQWEFGSTADKVVRNSRSPVFLVRPEALKRPA